MLLREVDDGLETMLHAMRVLDLVIPYVWTIYRHDTLKMFPNSTELLIVGTVWGYDGSRLQAECRLRPINRY
jgi:hypothetical protein